MDGHASGEALHLGFDLLKACIIMCVKLRADVRCFLSRWNVLVNIIQFPDIGRNAIITTFIKESAFFTRKRDFIYDDTERHDRSKRML